MIVSGAFAGRERKAFGADDGSAAVACCAKAQEFRCGPRSPDGRSPVRNGNAGFADTAKVFKAVERPESCGETATGSATGSASGSAAQAASFVAPWLTFWLTSWLTVRIPS